MSRVPVKIIHRLRSAVGLVVPWWSSFRTAFVDTGGRLPFVVSGSRSASRREGRLSSTASAPETRVRGLTTHCRRDPQNPKGDKTKGLGPLSAWVPEVGTEWPVRRLAGCLPLRAGRRCVSPAVTSAAPRSQKSHVTGHHRRRLPTHCTTSCAVILVHRTHAQPHAGTHSFISFHFISFHFISFHFISFHFISFHFISFHFISFHFISFHFISFHFISFHFISFHFISFHFISFHFISFHFISFHFISFHFISFHSFVRRTEHEHGTRSLQVRTE